MGNPMNHDDYTRHLETALEAECGLKFECQSCASAKHIREKLYYARNRSRREGHSGFDILSFKVLSNGELWIIRRDRLRGYQDNLPIPEPHPLTPDELPSYVNSRGPCKTPQPTLMDIVSLKRRG